MVWKYDKPWTRTGVQTLGISTKSFVCWATTEFDRSTCALLGPIKDPLRNVFRFSGCELTPNLEEIGAFIGKGKHLHKEEPMIPKHINGRRFLELLHINENDIGDCLDNRWVPLEFLYKRYDKSDGFEMYGKKLCNNGCRLTWEAHSYDDFVVAFLGIMLFPKKGGKISMNLTSVIISFW